MENLITVAVILAMIALGAFIVHLLNSQHAERIAAFRYHEPPPGIGARNTTPPQQSGGSADQHYHPS